MEWRERSVTRVGSGELVTGREESRVAGVEPRSDCTVENGDWRVRSQSGEFRLESVDWKVMRGEAGVES